MEQLQNQEISDKNRLVAFLLCYFCGFFGVHRFYVGKVGTGILMIFTCGGLGVWQLIDMILIILGRFKDDKNLLILNWNDDSPPAQL